MKQIAISEIKFKEEKEEDDDNDQGWELEVLEPEHENEVPKAPNSHLDPSDDMNFKFCEHCDCGGHEDEMILCDRCNKV